MPPSGRQSAHPSVKSGPYAVVRWVRAQDLGTRKHAHKLLLLVLATYADSVGRSFPSQRTLARDCNLSRQTVNEHLAWLEAQGYIVSRRQTAKGGRETSKEYVVLFRDGLRWPDGALVVPSGRGEAAGGRQTMSGVADGEGTGVPTEVVGRAGHLEGPSEEPKQEPSEPTARKRAGSEKDSRDQDDLYGLQEYILGLGARGCLNPEWADQDFQKAEWQRQWSRYVQANGQDQVSADISLLFEVIDDRGKAEIVSRFRKGQRDWVKTLAGPNSVPSFVRLVDELRSTAERFGPVTAAA